MDLNWLPFVTAIKGHNGPDENPIAIMYEKEQHQLDEARGNILRNQVIFSSHDQTVLKMQSYQPNLVARQFGLCQDLIVPVFSKAYEVLLGFTSRDANRAVALIDLFKERQLLYTPFDFTLVLYCTASFSDWWEHYYSSLDLSLTGCYERMKTIEYKQATRKSKKETSKVLTP